MTADDEKKKSTVLSSAIFIKDVNVTGIKSNSMGGKKSSLYSARLAGVTVTECRRLSLTPQVGGGRRNILLIFSHLTSPHISLLRRERESSYFSSRKRKEFFSHVRRAPWQHCSSRRNLFPERGEKFFLILLLARYYSSCIHVSVFRNRRLWTKDGCFFWIKSKLKNEYKVSLQLRKIWRL